MKRFLGKKMNEIKTLIPPSHNEWLTQNECGLHEAAFHLTTWPRGNDGTYYFPDPTKPFNPKNYDLKFQSVFESLEDAIKYRRIRGRHSTAIEGVSFSLNPIDVILWAMLNRYILPSELQKTLNFYQFENSNWKRVRYAVINKIIFQCIFAENPKRISLGDYLDHPWLQKIGIEKFYHDRSEKKALKRHLHDAIGFKASSGSQKSKSKLSIQLISEIMGKDGKYAVEALENLVDIVCNIVLLKIDPQRNPDSFLIEIMNHPVLEPYVKNAPEILLKLIQNICGRFVWWSPVKYLGSDKSTFEKMIYSEISIFEE
jgi:hypothetical protein